MRHDIVTAKTTTEQIKIFCEFADQFKTDFYEKPLLKFLDLPFVSVCAFLREKYCLEDGEQILRPKYFYAIGSDCDDALIFTLGLFLAAEIPKEFIYIVEAKESASATDFVHIFCALFDPKTKKYIWFDNLPGTDFNKLNYSMDQIRITPLTKYI